ncbi:MAG: thioredoxin-disulfide reductase [Epsilonproteobacteria bacterium]|nr:thioredoxin-disulfide reductase [Campylobacterota bacterium]
MSNIHKLVIIGAGPAGLTASIYAARANLSPIIIEGPKPGGQLMGTSAVENWPGEKSIMGPQLMMNMIEHAKKFDTEIISGSVTAVETSQRPFTITLDNDKQLQAHTIIMAAGATPNTLSCPGEDTYWGKGVSTCAVCDGAFYKDQPVIVVGGGDSGMESASFLARNNNKVTLVHIGKQLTASHAMQQRVLDNPQVEIIYNSTVTEIQGNGDNVTGAVITNQKTNETLQIDTNAVFLAIGLKPNTSMFKNQLEVTDFGHIKVHDLVKTSVEGIFAAGDVQDPKYRQAIVSAGFGCMAALEAERYISDQNL